MANRQHPSGRRNRGEAERGRNAPGDRRRVRVHFDTVRQITFRAERREQEAADGVVGLSVPNANAIANIVGLDHYGPITTADEPASTKRVRRVGRALSLALATSAKRRCLRSRRGSRGMGPRGDDQGDWPKAGPAAAHGCPRPSKRPRRPSSRRSLSPSRALRCAWSWTIRSGSSASGSVVEREDSRQIWKRFLKIDRDESGRAA